MESGCRLPYLFLLMEVLAALSVGAMVLLAPVEGVVEVVEEAAGKETSPPRWPVQARPVSLPRLLRPNPPAP